MPLTKTNQKSFYFQTKWLDTQNKLQLQYKFILFQPINLLNNTVQFNKSFSKNRNFDLRMKFKHDRLWITLHHTLLNYQYFYLVPGLLIKGFNYKKSIKRSFTVKLLLMKLIRKMLVMLKINNLNLIFKGTPTNLTRYIKALFTPVTHFVKNPISNELCDEITKKPFKINIHSIYFLKSLVYKPMKLKKRGRVKRKILRKLVLKNKLVD